VIGSRGNESATHLRRENTFYKDIFLSPLTPTNDQLIDFTLQSMLCWLLGKQNTPKFIIIADKYLYLRVEKFTTLMTILAPDGYIGSSEKVIGVKGSSLTNLCEMTSLSAAGFNQMMVSGLISQASADLMSCCPAETTYSIYPLNPTQMRQTDQHYNILHDYYDA